MLNIFKSGEASLGIQENSTLRIWIHLYLQLVLIMFDQNS